MLLFFTGRAGKLRHSFAVVLALFSTLTLAQDQVPASGPKQEGPSEPASRPRIGLALSGGARSAWPRSGFCWSKTTFPWTASRVNFSIGRLF